MKIQNIEGLKKVLLEEDWELIIFNKDGQWRRIRFELLDNFDEMNFFSIYNFSYDIISNSNINDIIHEIEIEYNNRLKEEYYKNANFIQKAYRNHYLPCTKCQVQINYFGSIESLNTYPICRVYNCCLYLNPLDFKKSDFLNDLPIEWNKSEEFLKMRED